MKNHIHKFSLLFLASACLLLGGCASSPRYLSPSPKIKGGTNTEKHSPKTQKSSGSKFTFYQEGKASFYGKQFHGRKTANGETYDMNKISAAHKELPFNTMVRVTNLSNNKSIIVRINDRGPFIGDRIIDLSVGAAKKLDMINDGVVPVRLEIQQ